VFSTVGFGDIAPHGDVARIIVTIQMLLDLVVIGSVVRLLTTAAKIGSDRAAVAGSAEPDGAVDETGSF
jgi:voltage-gated potassium channel